MACVGFRRTILRRWKLYERIGTDDTVLATIVQTAADKDEIRKMLFEENDPIIKLILTGDVVILTPDGFKIKHFIPFCKRFRRL